MTAVSEQPYVLTVLSGPNAGACEVLEARKFTIGGSDGAEFQLDGFLGPDVTIAFAKDRFRIQTERKDVAIADGATGGDLAKANLAGGDLIARLPAQVRLSDQVDIELRLARKPAEGYSRSSIVAITGGIGLCAIGILTAIQAGQLPVVSGANAGHPPGELEAKAAADKAAADGLAKAQAGADDGAARDAAPEVGKESTKYLTEGARAYLEQAIAEMGLALNVAADKGVLHVTGSVMKSQQLIWRSMREDYDRIHGNDVPLALSVKETNDKPPIAIASVWLGGRPQLTTRSGKSYRVGDKTDNGWTVSAIKEGSVELTRGRHSVVIDF